MGQITHFAQLFGYCSQHVQPTTPKTLKNTYTAQCSRIEHLPQFLMIEQYINELRYLQIV